MFQKAAISTTCLSHLQMPHNWEIYVIRKYDKIVDLFTEIVIMLSARWWASYKVTQIHRGILTTIMDCDAHWQGVWYVAVKLYFFLTKANIKYRCLSSASRSLSCRLLLEVCRLLYRSSSSASRSSSYHLRLEVCRLLYSCLSSAFSSMCLYNTWVDIC